MNYSLSRLRLIIMSIALAAAPLRAQTVATPYPVPPGNTSLNLSLDFRGGVIAPGKESRVSVPPGEHVVLNIPAPWDTTVQWMKDGQPILGATSNRLTILSAGASDTGTYSIAGRSQVYVAIPVALTIAPAGSVSNFSTLVLLGSHASSTVGFVVRGAKPKNFLIRAVGPSLKPFGISAVATQLHVRFFDTDGNEVNPVNQPASTDWSAVFNSVGAFALSAGPTGGDFYCMLTLPAGAYTAQLSDASGNGGTALFECYDLPE